MAEESREAGGGATFFATGGGAREGYAGFMSRNVGPSVHEPGIVVMEAGSGTPYSLR